MYLESDLSHAFKGVGISFGIDYYFLKHTYKFGLALEFILFWQT